MKQIRLDYEKAIREIEDRCVNGVIAAQKSSEKEYGEKSVQLHHATPFVKSITRWERDEALAMAKHTRDQALSRLDTESKS